MREPERIELRAVAWPEIGPGDDLVSLLAATDGLRDGDVILVTSKVVSKAEGRLVLEDRVTAIGKETRRVVARRGPTVIAETRHGLVMAAAGVDASNTPTGTALLLPLDPDATARALRDGVLLVTGLNVAVVVTDTAGRAWRLGQIDMAVGCAGLHALVDLQGTYDTHGNRLLVTAPAVADALAAAGDLVKGKATGRPVAVVSGLGDAVLPPGEDGEGARSLVREAREDLFGLGVREAVRAAVDRDDEATLSHFPQRTAGEPDPFDGLVERWRCSVPGAARDHVRATLTQAGCPEAPGRPGWALRIAIRDGVDPEALVEVGRLLERADVLAAGHRLVAHEHLDRAADPSWRQIVVRCWQDR